MPREQPLLGIIDREPARRHAEENFTAQILLLQDFVNYGSNLIIRAFNSSEKQLRDVVACGVFLKQIVGLIDSVELLISAGTAYPAFLPARAAFEASVYLDWMLFSDSEKKAKYYVVSNYRDERRWASRGIRGSIEDAALSSITRSIGLDIHSERPSLEGEAKRHLKEVDRILAQPDFKNIDLEFDALRKRRKHDPFWYEPLGMRSLRAIAKAVQREPEYEFFYGRGSSITHTSQYKDQIRFSHGKVSFKQIRHLSGIEQLVTFVGLTALKSFHHTLLQYRNEEAPAFLKKYLEDWRAPFQTVRPVTYKTEMP